MNAGRKQTPTQLKILRNNPGRGKLNADEPQPARGPMKVPSWLTERGKRAFRELAKILDDMRVLTQADRLALSLLCDAVADYRELTEHLRKHGRTYEVITTAGSKLQPEKPVNTLGCTLPGMETEQPVEEMPEGGRAFKARPEVEMQRDAWRRVMSALSEFGLTPSARAKVGAIKDLEDDDPVSALQQRRRALGQ